MKGKAENVVLPRRVLLGTLRTKVTALALRRKKGAKRKETANSHDVEKHMKRQTRSNTISGEWVP